MAANDQTAISWWRLNETAGPDALDMRGANPGTYQGGVTLGGASGATFDGSTGYVSVADSASLDGINDDSWWVAARVVRGALGANRTIISKGSNGWNLRLDTTGKPQIVKSNVAVLVTAPAAIDTNPHVIAMTKSLGSNLLKLFVDGLLVASVTPAAGAMPIKTDLPLTIGCDSFSAGGRQEFWNGTISGVGVSNKPLTTPIVEPVTSQINGGPAQPFLPAPAILTAYRDPAAVSSTTVPVQVDVIVLHGGSVQSGNCTVLLQATGGGGSGLVYLNSVSLPVVNGLASTSFPMQYLDNDKNLSATVNANATSYTPILRCSFALARLPLNVELGDAPTGISASSALTALSKPPDVGAIWYRACNGPNPTDYAPGSAWTTVLATAVAQLPASGPFLAVQFQIVRMT